MVENFHGHGIRCPMTIFDPDNPEHILQLCALALTAGRNAMRHYAADVAVDAKADNSPVTIADLEGEEILTKGIEQHFDKIQIIGEEAASLALPDHIENRFFLLDALDGTREFINKRTDFTVNIGFIENGQPEAGVIYAPALGDLYFTGKSGAFLLSVSPDDPMIDDFAMLGAAMEKAEKLTPRTPDSDAGMIVIASRSHRAPETDSYLETMQVQELVSAGSSLKFCLVARGKADIYPRHGRTMEWDTAAGHAILRAAGGRVEDLDSNMLGYGKLERGLDNPHVIAFGC